MDYNIYDAIAYLYGGKMILAEIGAETLTEAGDLMKKYIINSNLRFEVIETGTTNLVSSKKGILEIIKD